MAASHAAQGTNMCALLRILGCMPVQDLFTTQFVPNRDATPTSWRRANDSGRHPIPVGAVVVHRQSGDKPGQLRFRHCGSGGHRIRKKTHGARTVRARFRQHPQSRTSVHELRQQHLLLCRQRGDTDQRQSRTWSHKVRQQQLVLCRQRAMLMKDKVGHCSTSCSNNNNCCVDKGGYL